jgi:hypothetical protein
MRGGAAAGAKVGADADTGADTDAAGAEDKGNLRVLVLTCFLRNRLSFGGAVDVLAAAAAVLGFCDTPAPDPDDPTGGKDRRGIGLAETEAAILDAAATAAGFAAAATGATGGSFLRGMLFIIILAGGLPSLFEESGFMVTCRTEGDYLEVCQVSMTYLRYGSKPTKTLCERRRQSFR